jgi:hypothetical protein
MAQNWRSPPTRWWIGLTTEDQINAYSRFDPETVDGNNHGSRLFYYLLNQIDGKQR